MPEPYQLGKYVYILNGEELPDRDLVGGKAWSISRMMNLGLRVPPAIVITTDACREYLREGDFPSGLAQEVEEAVGWLESTSGRTLGGGTKPLLLSVRSGASVSMPGMMDTILNLGINPVTASAIAEETSDPVFANDTYSRFVSLYAKIVLKAVLPENPSSTPMEMISELKRLDLVIPEDPRGQLMAAIQAVFESWNTRRARKWREKKGIDDSLGTAVTLQAMVFGNLGHDSGTGVLFSRNTLSGEVEPQGEYLTRAQGEDVVSGSVTPQSLEELAEAMPPVYRQLLEAASTLERENLDVQDIEFTVENGQLFFLQARTAKRAPIAAVRFAIDMVKEGLIDERTAVGRVSSEQVKIILNTPFLPREVTEVLTPLAVGYPACPGVASGLAIDDPDEAERLKNDGEKVILVRGSTSPEDVHGMMAATAVITEEGGHTSHAAVVSRDLGLPAVVGCGRGVTNKLLGQIITVDANEGKVYKGRLECRLLSQNDIPALRQLEEYAIRVSKTTVVPKDNSVGITVDLDELEGGDDPDEVQNLISKDGSVTGGCLNTDAGVKAAVRAGVGTIISNQTLPVLLVAIQEHNRLEEIQKIDSLRTRIDE
jgi:pyruvate,orthophosphate dikinase